MRLPILPMLILIAIGLAIDFYIYRCIGKRVGGKFWPRVQAVTALAVNLALIVLISLPRRSGDDSQFLTIMWGLYAYLTIYVSKILFVVFDLLARLPQLWHARRLRWLSRAGIVIAIVTALIMVWGALINRFDLQVKEVDIEIDGLPESFDGYRLVQISDIHLGTYGRDTTFISDVIDAINALRPDAVMFTGDIVNRHEPEAEPFVTTLSRLKARDGVYAILGNHDYGDYYDWPTAEAKKADRESMIKLFNRIGWDLLLNDSRALTRGNDTIALIGVENVGDPPFKVYGDLTKAYPAINDPKTKILLSHTPYHWTSAIADNPEANVALTLSGHTHAMQLEAFGLSPAKWRYDTWGGDYTDSLGRHMYVNIGIGEVGVPMRIGANPEITLITLKRKP